MAPAEGGPDDPIGDNPEQPPSEITAEIAELKRMVMENMVESRDSQKRLYAALESNSKVSEAGMLARVPPGTYYSSPHF